MAGLQKELLNFHSAILPFCHPAIALARHA